MCKTARSFHALKTFLKIERDIGTISIWFVQNNWRYPNRLLYLVWYFLKTSDSLFLCPTSFITADLIIILMPEKKIDHNNYFIGCFSLRVSFVFSPFYSRSWKTSYIESYEYVLTKLRAIIKYHCVHGILLP